MIRDFVQMTRENLSMGPNRRRVARDLGGRLGLFPPFRSSPKITLLVVPVLAVVAGLYFIATGQWASIRWLSPVITVPIVALSYLQLKWLHQQPEWLAARAADMRDAQGEPQRVQRRQPG